MLKTRSSACSPLSVPLPQRFLLFRTRRRTGFDLDENDLFRTLDGMSNASPMAIYDRLTRLERELQRLKVEAFFALPPKMRKQAIYSNKSIQRALKETRTALWKERYAKKVARLS